ncbi:MAG: hypothetical protein AAF193_00105 [Bacteroidota bacterium]
MERSKEDYLQLILSRIKKQYVGSVNIDIDPETYQILNRNTNISEKTLRQMFTGTYKSTVQIGTLSSLCRALGKESFQEFVDEIITEEGLIPELEASEERIDSWLKLDGSELGRMSLKYNQEKHGISQPLVVPLQFAADRKFWKNWAFCSAILNEPLKMQKINSRFRLHVGMHDELLAIYNNAGKEFLNQVYLSEEKLNKDEIRSKELNAFLNGENDKSEHTIDSLPLRWASGGVLPLVSFKHPKHSKTTDWVLLFYRDLNPTAWTIPLGGSHNIEELSHLTKLLFREFSE